MKISTKQITMTGVLLALAIASQFIKVSNAALGQILTGSIINACIVLLTLSAGPVCGVILSIITPVTAFIITGTPLVAAIPSVMPMIMIGNAILALAVWFVHKLKKDNNGLLIGMGSGCVLKALFMGITIALILIPKFLPEPMLPKKGFLQVSMSFLQLLTALIGCALAYVIWIPVKKILREQ